MCCLVNVALCHASKHNDRHCSTAKRWLVILFSAQAFVDSSAGTCGVTGSSKRGGGSEADVARESLLFQRTLALLSKDSIESVTSDDNGHSFEVAAATSAVHLLSASESTAAAHSSASRANSKTSNTGWQSVKINVFEGAARVLGYVGAASLLEYSTVTCNGRFLQTLCVAKFSAGAAITMCLLGLVLLALFGFIIWGVCFDHEDGPQELPTDGHGALGEAWEARPPRCRQRLPRLGLPRQQLEGSSTVKKGEHPVPSCAPLRSDRSASFATLSAAESNSERPRVGAGAGVLSAEEQLSMNRGDVDFSGCNRGDAGDDLHGAGQIDASGALMRRSASASSLDDFQDRHLSAQLVVPPAMEFVFAIRESLVGQRQHVALTVIDMGGQTLFHVFVDERERSGAASCGITVQFTNKEDLAFINTEMLYAGGSSESAACLEIRRPGGDIFCKVMRETFGGAARTRGNGKYTLRRPDGELLASFDGDFHNKAINSTDPQGRLVCATRRTTIGVKNTPCTPFFEVRVAPSADAGLLLCGLLAIAKLEGRTSLSETDQSHAWRPM